MSYKEHSGAPAETQQSGFGGERWGSAADGLSPQAEAGGRNPSPGVSRETLWGGFAAPHKSMEGF